MRGIAGSKFGWLAAGLIAFGLAIRLRWFGSPIVHVDEQFYLLVGDRMLDGAIPYLDVWDRKPVGLFLIYAAIRLLGGDGILQYQMVASVVAIGTALIIARWVLDHAGAFAAGLAGVLYLLLLQRLSGYGGEAEVFMNFFLATGAWLVWRAAAPVYAGEVSGDFVRRGMLAMLVAGLAIQVKTTVVFPVMFLGLALIWTGHRARLGSRRLTAAAAGWALAALLPTIVAASYYLAIGHWSDFHFANFGSVSLRGSDDAAILVRRFASQAQWAALPLGVAALAAGLSWRRLGGDRPLFVLLGSLLLACLLAFVFVGTFYDNYALILAVVTALLFGLVIRTRASVLVASVCLALFAGVVMIKDQQRLAAMNARLPEFHGVVAAVKRHVGTGALFVFRGYPAYYYASRAKIPTRFAFPNHLSMGKERHALGVDPLVEVERLFAQRPKVVIYSPDSEGDSNEATDALVRRHLAKDYRLVRQDGPAGINSQVYVRSASDPCSICGADRRASAR